MTTAPLEPLPSLHVCASRLLSISRDSTVDPGVALHCLRAVDLLETCGARPVPIAPARIPVPNVIRDVLAELAELPADVFARPGLADAAAACRRALELAELRSPQ